MTVRLVAGVPSGNGPVLVPCITHWVATKPPPVSPGTDDLTHTALT